MTQATSVQSSFAAQMEQSIQAAVQTRMREIVEEEMAKAIERVRRRIGEEADRLALSVMQHYSFADHGHRLVIEVRKPDAGHGA